MTQPSPKQRTAEEIRESIAAQRHELASSVVELSAGVQLATNWRRQVARHPKEIGGAAIAVGFILGGGLVALGGLLG